MRCLMNKLFSKRPHNPFNTRFMKRLIISAVLLISLSVNAQLKNKLGSYTLNELRMTKCEFDEQASAAILCNEGSADYNDNYDLITYRYTRLKIFKESGVKHADFYFDYRSDGDLENIVGLEALVTNLDENGNPVQIPVDRKSIYRTRINEKFSRITMAMPQVKAGSVIEYTFRIAGKHYGMLRDWEFQNELPVYNSSFDLKMVPNLEMTYLLQYNKKYPLEVKPDKDAQSVFFRMQNIPGLSEEPYMDSKDDYIQKVIFQITRYAGGGGWINYMSSWDEVFRELNGRPDFGRQLRINIDECKPFLQSVKGKSEYEQMCAIYRHVQGSSNWNGRYGVVTDKGIKELWKTGVGTAAEINLSLVNLLVESGLKAAPLLVSERENGRINKNIPFIDQFNNVFALVQIGERRFILDATDKFQPPQLTPASVLNTSGFVVHAKWGGLIDIEEKNCAAKEAVSINARIGSEGDYSGGVYMVNREYSKVERLRQYSPEKKDEYISRFVVNGLVNVDVDSLQIENTGVDTIDLRQKFKFKTHLQNTGEYTFVNVNMFSGFEQNPFINPNRFSTVNFGFNRSSYVTTNIRLSPEFKVDVLPANIRLKNEDGSVVFTREVFFDEKAGQLVARLKVDVMRSVFPVAEYPALQEFYKKMIDMMNEPIILKKI
jgi:hypothetical protein